MSDSDSRALVSEKFEETGFDNCWSAVSERVLGKGSNTALVGPSVEQRVGVIGQPRSQDRVSETEFHFLVGVFP